MKRRYLLGLLGLSIIALGAVRYYEQIPVRQSVLALNLKPYFHPGFSAYAPTINAGEVLAMLIEKGVISKDGSVNIALVKTLASSDKIVEVNGLNYTEAEAGLHGLAYLAHGGNVVWLEGHDLMGGDYENHVVSDASECYLECQSDKKCTGFTFAKNSHPLPEKHNMCYLKNKPFVHLVDGDYISGLR